MKNPWLAKLQELARSHSSGDRLSLQQLILRLQLIVVALVPGALLFLLVAFTVRQVMGPADPGIMTYALLLSSIALMILQAVIPTVIGRISVRRLFQTTMDYSQSQTAEEIAEDSKDLREGILQIYHTVTIIGAAMTEAAAINAILAYLLEGSLVAAGMGLLCGITIPLIHMPSEERINAWMAEKLRMLEDERQFSI